MRALQYGTKSPQIPVGVYMEMRLGAIVAGMDKATGRLQVPTFTVAGAIKSGTTSLYNYLNQHPAICMTEREEPNFFAFAGQRPQFRGPNGSEAPINSTSVTQKSDYLQLFANGFEEAKAFGDVSPVYLYWAPTTENLVRWVPDIRIIVVLRHPVARAYSSFMHLMRTGREPLTDFTEALAAEEQRIDENWGFLWRYVDIGRYAHQLERYYDVFGRKQVMVELYDHLARDPVDLCRRIQEFVGVDPNFSPDTNLRHNMGGVPRSRLAAAVLRPSAMKRFASSLLPHGTRQHVRAWLVRARNRNLIRDEMPDQARIDLARRFEPEIQRLSRVIGRDLSSWL